MRISKRLLRLSRDSITAVNTKAKRSGIEPVGRDSEIYPFLDYTT